MPALFCVLLLVCVLVPGASGLSPLINTGESNPTAGTVEATLYFRYRTSGLLARERRVIPVPRSMPEEQAVVNALVEGPGTLSPYLTPLFPAGTQVLSVAAEGETLFITFNDRLMARYADEAPLPPPEYQEGEGRLRRELAMAGLVNTLTESGRYRAVQVLVRDENYISASMRLSSRYYLHEQETFPPPLTRREGFIHSPEKSAAQFMGAWQAQDWQAALQLVRGVETDPGDSLPTEHALSQRLAQAPRLSSFTITGGTVALDGQSAVVSVSYTLLEDDGAERSIEARPFRLLLQEGIFLVPFDTALRVLELSDE